MISAGWGEAIEELSRRKLRTLLTLLGMIFGVGAMVAMQGVGEGSRREALKLVDSLGLHNLIVEAKSQSGDALKEARARSIGLTVADAQAALDVVPSAERFAAEKQIKVLSVFSDGGHADAQIEGVSPDYFQLASQHLELGRALNANDDASLAAVAVLGHQAAYELFPDGKPLGRLFKANQTWLRVVGVLADRDLDQNKFEGVALGGDSNTVFVPLSSARARFRFQPMEDEISRFLLRINDPSSLASDANVLTQLLDQRHAGVSDYRLIVPQQLYQQNQKTQRIFSVVMGTIAGVSLLVGGIGIMNIMLANVLERRREIGLLRAIGARRQDIVQRFLREAVVICASGALIGLLFGAALAYAIAAFAGWHVAWAPVGIIISVVACTLIGLGFSIYPSRQAAALDPIAAIRDE
ncbi:ABC transporter permease [Dyella nitratireducens]|uniref:ABC transporter permease n=1 Tax=Dyella nitratireducens TaxID=1849580 RepID=A0ABQ1FUY4_9GAMM|nr:ABC transporter permease [Dyella nitratireducens]GGA29681.1 ABC transporter permease [Dyella nitratireducens]GLQ43106.1 ABC transporter permease [Dyella nitratireducens]